MRQWNGRRAGEVLTEIDENASPEARLHFSIKSAINKHKRSLENAQTLLGEISATLKQIDSEIKSNPVKKS